MFGADLILAGSFTGKCSRCTNAARSPIVPTPRSLIPFGLFFKIGNGVVGLAKNMCVVCSNSECAVVRQVDYCGTKGAISMLAKALACDLGAHGIRVNAVEPGWVMTNMSAPLMEDPAAVKYYNDRIALHRGAQPTELAATIAYLLSPDASYVTAATLLVDGGFIVNAEL